jgi:hypothetical protein
VSVVEVSINTSGSIDNCKIVGSAGFKSLDTVTCDWISQNWRWIPPTMDGKPIPVTTRVSMNWTLRNASSPSAIYSKNIETLHNLLPRQAPELISACYVQGKIFGVLDQYSEVARKNALCFFIGDQVTIYIPESTTPKLLFGLVGGKKLEAALIKMPRENIVSYSVSHKGENRDQAHGITKRYDYMNTQIQITDPKDGSIYFWMMPGIGENAKIDYDANERTNQFATKLDALGIKKVGATYFDIDFIRDRNITIDAPPSIFIPR